MTWAFLFSRSCYRASMRVGIYVDAFNLLRPRKLCGRSGVTVPRRAARLFDEPPAGTGEVRFCACSRSCPRSSSSGDPPSSVDEPLQLVVVLLRGRGRRYRRNVG
jgi:hypothetical protein